MPDTEPNIPWLNLTKFVGQLNHDLRNHLNAIELQAAFLNEIIEDGEAKTEIKRLREMTRELGAHLQRLSDSLRPVQPQRMRYLAREFGEDLQSKIAEEKPEKVGEVEWTISLGEEALEIDPQLLQEAFLELFRNAGRHGRGDGALVFVAEPDGQRVQFQLREPKTKFEAETKNWGQRPLSNFGHGHYGLGLHRARSIFEAHHGDLQAQFDADASRLVTTVSFPFVP
ncbi:MAG: hypothetical protein M3Q46_05920 [Verrucomicrobiota bacterium]|nr:hypothetical protein [Verrucomicrobiota bacterium]